MTKTLLCGVAAIAFTLAAPSAFAQDADMDVKAKPKAEQMMDATEEAADDAMDATEDMMDDAADEMDDAAGDVEAMMDDDMGDMDDEMDVEVAVKADASTTAACPSGTEMQSNGSCMITGDWAPED
jgi:hypothetical protein